MCLASTPDSEPGCCPLAGSACFIRFSARPTVFSHPSKITYPLTLKGGHTPRKRELTITFDRISQFMDPTILYYIGSYSDILSSIFHADPVWFGGWFGKNAVRRCVWASVWCAVADLGKPLLAIVPGCISFILMGVAIIHLFVFFPSGIQNRIDVRDGSHRLLPYSGE